jgi:AcrR family transcriptional regulator
MKRAEQSVATRTALLEAAKRLFVTRGYLNTKINDIAAEAGRAAGSFYSHFASKEELLTALLKEVEEAGDRQARSGEHSADFSDPEAIRFHVAVYLSVEREHGATMRALAQAALVNADFARLLEDFRRAQYADLLDHLSGLTDLPAKPSESLAMVLAVVERTAEIWPGASDAEALDGVTRFLYRALHGRDY